jgi:colanic acid biosynthesis glycosyl transferase WcaI
MKKRILLLGYNFHPEPTGIGKYTGEMVYWLAQQGYACTVITAYPYYPYWKVQEPYRQTRFWFTTEKQVFASGGSLVVYRCPMYVPAQPSGLKRILLDLTFLASALVKLLPLLPGRKGDLVCTVVPSFQFGLLGVFYKKMCKARFLYHIQDMQIEIARDLKMIKSGRIINFLFQLEKYILNQADVISSISEGMVRKIKAKARKEVFLFPNWTDTKQFFPLPDRTTLKEKFGFASTDRILLYSGAIGEKQGLEAILQAADHFKCQPNWKFVICGSGPYKAILQSLKERLQLSNVIFLPLQPVEQFNLFLNVADVHLIIQKANTCDLVMPSKLTTVLAVGGLALITADKGTCLYDLVEKYKMGILVDAENQENLNEGIQVALLGENTESITANARAYAENHLEIESVMKTFVDSVWPDQII